MNGSTRRGTTSITVTVNEDVLAYLDELARRKNVERGVLIRHLLSEALQARARQGRP